MHDIKTEFLFTIALEVPALALGDTPYGGRRIARFGSGTFEGPTFRQFAPRSLSVAKGTLSARTMEKLQICRA